MITTTLLVFLFSGVISLSWALTVNIPASIYEVARGDNITIPCTFSPKNAINQYVMIEWLAHADVDTDPNIQIINVFVHANGTAVTDVDDGYQGRASVQYDIAKRIANLQLRSVTSKDSRVYACQVVIPGDSGKQATTTVVVLVAPSKPICNVQGKAEYYQNISLTCNSAEGTPTPTYQWTSYDVRNTSRPNPPKSTDVNGVLSLYNISADTSGYYICTSKNKIRSDFCNLTLSVMPPSMNIASTAGIIGGVLAVLVLLLVVICCCCRKKKEKPEEYGMRAEGGGEYTDNEHHLIGESQDEHVDSKPERNANLRDQYEDHGDHDFPGDRYSGRRDEYDTDDRRRGHNDDRRDDRYGDRRDDRHGDRREDRYGDRRDDRHDDRRDDRYDDRRDDRYDDRRDDRYDDRHDRYNDRDRPPLKPSRA